MLKRNRLSPAAIFRGLLTFEFAAIARHARCNTASVALPDPEAFGHRLAAEEIDYLAYRLGRPVTVRAEWRSRQHMPNPAIGDLFASDRLGESARFLDPTLQRLTI